MFAVPNNRLRTTSLSKERTEKGEKRLTFLRNMSTKDISDRNASDSRIRLLSPLTAIHFFLYIRTAKDRFTRDEIHMELSADNVVVSSVLCPSA